MKKRFAKILSLALALIMVLSVLPTAALAQTNGTRGTSVLTDWADWIIGWIIPRPKPRPTYPAQTLSFEGRGGTLVSVDAPAGALPANTSLEINDTINATVLQDAYDRLADERGTVLKAVDISFLNSTGNEVEPRQAVTVTLSSDVIAELDEFTLVHFDCSADELGNSNVHMDVIEDCYVSGSTVTFEATDFSVYAVIGDDGTGDFARAAVEFYDYQQNLIATMYIKNRDTLEELEYIVYDPGAGTIPANSMFVGWSYNNPNYTVNVTESPRWTIQKVREFLDQQTVTEGQDPYKFYAMVFQVYTVSYLGETPESGVAVSLSSESIVKPTGSDPTVQYTVNLQYTPAGETQSFNGWIPDSASIANIDSAVDDHNNPVQPPYDNGTVLTIHGSITLSVDAPEGHWLVFNENGKGATYIAPDFIPMDETTSRPTETMSRFGYTFDDWYLPQWEDDPDHPGQQRVKKDSNGYAVIDENSEKFVFGQNLTEDVNVYANWIPNSNAAYTIILWMQNVDGVDADGNKKYDFDRAITIEGATVGAVPNDITVTGTDNDAYVTIQGIAYRESSFAKYKGFHYVNHDESVKVRTEGDSVINVFYDRNEYTLSFQVRKSRGYYEVLEPDWTAWAAGNVVYYAYVNNSRTQIDYVYTFTDGTYWVFDSLNTTSTWNLNTNASSGTFWAELEDEQLYPMRYNGGNWEVNVNYWDSETANWIRYDRLSTNQHTSSGIYRIADTVTNPTIYIYLSSASWVTVKEITALYGQNISDYFVTFVGSDGVNYTGARWDPQSNSQGWNEVMVLVASMPNESITFRRDTTDATGCRMYYYVQALQSDIDDPTVDKVTYDGMQFVLYTSDVINAEYNGVTIEDYLDLVGFDKKAVTDSNLNPASIPSGIFYQANGSRVYDIFFFYTRQVFDIRFNDGVYVDGNGNALPMPSLGTFNTDKGKNIYYNDDISSYNKDGSNFYQYKFNNDYDNEFVFEGWYLDTKCTQPANFDHMPLGGINVYAKWRQVQYRVYLDPKADNDQSLDWGQVDPTLCFRVSYKEGVETQILRRGQGKTFLFMGWFMKDPETDKDVGYNKNGYKLDHENEKYMTSYDQATEITDEFDPWGNIVTPENEDAPYNSDARNGRFWITKKLELYAIWRAVLDGADGIQIRYDLKGGSDPYNHCRDPKYYLDKSDAVAVSAPDAPNGKIFQYWVLQTWNGDEFVDAKDADGHLMYYYPGQTFKVLETDSQITPIEGNPGHNTYLVQLRAQYGDVHVGAPTHIFWYANNDATGNTPGQRHEDNGIEVNQPVNIPVPDSFSVPSRDGEETIVPLVWEEHVFLGWARVAVNEDNPAKAHPELDEDDLFLKWDSTTKKYLVLGDGYTAEDNLWVEQVAADERLDYHDLYAVWATKFYVYHSSSGEVEMFVRTKNDTSVDIAHMTSDGYLYGGYYTDYLGTSDGYVSKNLGWTDVKDGFDTDNMHQTKLDADAVKYQPETNADISWEGVRPYTDCGLELEPVAGMTYYIKEVKDTVYLQPYFRYTYKLGEGRISTAWLISDVDVSDYAYNGFMVETVSGEGENATVTDTKYIAAEGVVSSLTIVNAVGNGSYTVKPQKFGVDENGVGYITYATVFNAGDYGDPIPYMIEAGQRVYQYWVTPDGCLVTGTTYRVYRGLTNANGIGQTPTTAGSKIVKYTPGE